MKKILISIISFILFLIFLEIVLRIFLKEKFPENYISIFTPFYRTSNNPKLGYENIPNWSGFATGTNININCLGARGSEIKPKNKKRILLIGDSMIFGFGLKEKYTISNQLKMLLNENDFDYEIINAGVNGYNLLQNLENVKKYYDELKADFVIISFIHNDVENLFLERGLSFPEFKTTYFNETNKKNLSYKIYNFLANEELLKRNRYKNRTGLRNFLLNNSYLYLFITLQFKKIVLMESGGEFPNPYLYYFPESVAVETLINKPLHKILNEFYYYAKTKNINYTIAVLNDHFLSKKFESKLLQIFDAEKINYTLLSPFIPSLTKYYKNYTLGWDSHPNKKGAKLYAELFFDILNLNETVSIKKYYFFNKELYLKKYSEYMNYLQNNTDTKNFDLKFSIDFRTNFDNKNYPVWGLYDFSLRDLQNNPANSFEREVSKYFSILLKKSDKKIFYLSAKKIIKQNLDMEININSKIFRKSISDNEFIIEIPVQDILNEKLDVFITNKNYEIIDDRTVSFKIKEVGVK